MAVTFAFVASASQSGGPAATLGVSVGIGAADAARKVVAVVRLTAASGSPTGYAFTIGGIAAAIDRQISDVLFIISADVPTGTTATVSATLTGATISAIAAATYRLIGPVAVHDAVSTSGGGGTPSVAIGETPGGATIAAMQQFFTGTMTWTYPATKDANLNNFTSAASGAASGSGSTLQASSSGAVYLGGVHYKENGVTANAVFTLEGIVVAATGDPAGAKADAAILLDEFQILATDIAFEANVAFVLDEFLVEATDIPQVADVAFALAPMIVQAVVDIDVPEDQFIRVLLGLETGDALIVLLTISHPTLAEPKRFALSRPGKNIISNGEVFTAAYFDARWLSDTKQAPRATLRVINVDRVIGNLLDGLETPPFIRMDLVLASNPDKLERSVRNARLINARWGASMVEGEVGYPDYSRVPWPFIAATPAYCIAMFK